MCHCGHPKGLHVGISACRVNGCPCERFRDASQPDVAEPETVGRRVCFDIPDGFTLTVSLVPVVVSEATAEPFVHPRLGDASDDPVGA